MSYIRCLSNPESLYVWSDGKNTHVSHGVRKPHSSGDYFHVPSRAFDRVLKKWAKGERTISCDGIMVKELMVDAKTGEITPEIRPCKHCSKVSKGSWRPCKSCVTKGLRDAKRSRHVIRLSYKKDFVNLWHVTFAYMARRFYK